MSAAAAREGKQEILRELIEVLTSMRALADPHNRELWLQLARQELFAVDAGPARPLSNRPGIPEIVDSLADQLGGIRTLVVAAGLLAPDSDQIRRLSVLADEWDAADLYPAEALATLRRNLVGVTVSSVAALWRDTVGDRAWTLPDHCATPWHVFVHLTGMNAPPDKVPPSLEFLNRLAADLDQTSARPIRAWVSEQARAWGLEEELAALPVQMGLEGERSAAYLVIQLERHGLDENRFVMSHWTQTDAAVWRPVRGEDRLVGLDEVEQVVDHLVDRLEEFTTTAGGPEIVVEFVLPIDLLQMPVEQFNTEFSSGAPVPLGMRYPVVVRSLERLRTARWHRGWRQRWQQLSAARHVEPWWGDDRADPLSLEAALGLDRTVTALVLSEPPGRASGNRQLLAALRAGVPVVIWHREDCHSQEFLNAAGDLMHGQNGTTLPELVRSERLRAMQLSPDQRASHVGHNIVLLWDDPDRQPGMSAPAGMSGPADP